MTDTLPDKPSALIRLGLKDMKQREADPAYRIDMGQWHVPRTLYRIADEKSEVCCVCMAGAIMATTLGVPPQQAILPRDLDVPDETKTRLAAIDSFREGRVGYALFLLDNKPPEGVPHRTDIPVYADDPEGFYTAMDELAALLERAGL